MSIPLDADEVKKHIPNKCKFCPNLSNCISLGNVFACGESRYVVEAVVNTHVIEHQSLKAVACPLGDIKLRGEFPEDVKAHVQYGKSFTVLASILNTTGAFRRFIWCKHLSGHNHINGRNMCPKSKPYHKSHKAASYIIRSGKF